MRAKTVPLALEVAAQIGEVVNFAVVGNPDRAVFVAHRHVAVGRKIENGQPPAAQPNVPAIRETALPEPGIVGAAVRLHLRHAGEGLRRFLEIHGAEDCAGSGRAAGFDAGVDHVALQRVRDDAERSSGSPGCCAPSRAG